MVAAEPAVWLVFLALTGLAPMAASNGENGAMPRFVEKVPNITVTVGRDAMLPCTVEQLKGYKVAWVQVDTQTILTIHKQVITRNPRIALLHNDHRTWHLQLKNVRESDRGWYMCQVNTDPMRYRQGYVDVVVPPDIIDKDSSGDLTVREGQDVTLTCRAKGHPTPTIVWRREDNRDIVLDTENTDMVGVESGVGISSRRDGGSPSIVGGSSGSPPSLREVKGEVLELKKVSRLQMGSYLCIASNGVPPSISKRANLRVQFPPMAWVPQQLEGAYVGQELTIECHTEAFPKSINYWTNNNGDMIVAGERYEPIVADSSYKIYMKLRIRRVEPQDFGTFKCVAKNSLGETDGAIKVYEIDPPKSHLNPSPGGEEQPTEGNSSQDFETVTTPASDPQSKDRKKFENFLYPKGVNDLTDYHPGGKTFINPKDQDYRQSRRPGFSGSTGKGTGAFPKPIASILCASLALVASYAMSFSSNYILLTGRLL
ncbi:lachesin-like [Macrobrachium rosenbergii]|uniref:lachesin-like n=1 Tax=Macrobrachium rosenbergii TaxID=79674 RepID=UPI0034D692E5